jgi:proteic killer suppression protein
VIRSFADKRSSDLASIGVNDQWCLCFVWRTGDAYDVEIVHHH